MSSALVGRDEELGRLISATRSAPSVVLVEGEAGVGKTRLVAELLRLPAVSGRRLLMGACHQIRESFPLGCVIEAVRGIGASLPKLRLTGVAGALGPLVPELAPLLPPMPEPLDDRLAERHRVFRALVDVLAASMPAVLVLEDLHWADEQTVDFLGYLLAEPPRDLALVLTYRSEQVSAAIRALTARLPANVVQDHLALSTLDQQETGALAAAILGVDRVSAEFAGYLWERTSGLPYAVEELLALVRARGLIVKRASGWVRRELDELEVPRRIRASTLERVARLPTSAQRLVEAAAVLQNRVPLSVLLALIDGVDAVEALEAAVSAGLLVESGDLIGFRHMLAAQAVYENLSGPRRTALHGRAAAALESARPVPLGQVAHHLRNAGQLEKWAACAEAAADQALVLGDDAEATRLLDDVVRTGPLTPHERGQLAVKLGRAATQTLRAHDMLGTLSDALRDDLPWAIRGELRLLVASTLNQYGEDLPRQRRLLADAAADLVDRPDLRAWATVGLGMPVARDVPLAEDVACLHRALALAEETEDPQLQVFVMGKVGAVLLDIGDPAWRDLVGRVRAATGDSPRQRQDVNAYYTLGSGAAYAGQVATAEFLLATGLRAPAVRENRRLEVMLRSAVALLRFYCGDWSGLDGEITSLSVDQSSLRRSRVDIDLVAGCLALAHGDVDQARLRLEEVATLCEDLGAFDVLAPAMDALAGAALAQGDVATALASVRRGLDPLRSKGFWAPVARLLPRAVEALAAAGEPGQAWELVGQAGRELADRDVPLAPAALSYAHGVLRASAADFRAAARHYLDVPAPYEAARANERAADCMLASGDAQAAEVVLRDAVAAYERLGAAWDLTRAAALARQHGVALPARHRNGRGYGDALSPRQRDVAKLAAKGRTNKEIAQELFLSVNTVEKHLGVAMRKLRARSRTELAHRLAGDAHENGEYPQ